jgi:biopolymer transport protein ExbD
MQVINQDQLSFYLKTCNMSAIENISVRNQSSKRKLVKRNTRVDLTPMVDLGFLLITFFVFTTQLSQPTAMNLNMPYDKVDPGDLVCASCVLTVILKENNVIQYYQGMASVSTIVDSTDFKADGIRRILSQKRASVKNSRGKVDDFVVVIKSTQESTFQNFVDMMDEVTIGNIRHYYVAEIDAEERKFLGFN